MPICEIDPWRLQYFEGVDCPTDVFIPTEDSDAWIWNPKHRWIYDKLAVALSQGLDAGPHGVMPPSFPVFSKPIYNLKGMGIGSRVVKSANAYKSCQKPGHFWTTLLEGEHVSSDVALVNGQPRWWRHAKGYASGKGTFDYWQILREPNEAVEAWCGQWCARHLVGYTGMVNVETIGGRIIEAHLRFADQWPDLYGQGWTTALVRLYAKQDWEFKEPTRNTGYSVVLFVPPRANYRHPPAEKLKAIRRTRGVSSLQITFHEGLAPRLHAMPPGGFRVAIVNCWDRDAGNAARDILRECFNRQAQS